MMLSLLDFAGHSAYYACHHIFCSPRVIFILVVDMSKDLNDLATQACKETDLIYSSWTYAGTNNALLYPHFLHPSVCPSVGHVLLSQTARTSYNLAN